MHRERRTRLLCWSLAWVPPLHEWLYGPRHSLEALDKRRAAAEIYGGKEYNQDEHHYDGAAVDMRREAQEKYGWETTQPVWAWWIFKGRLSRPCYDKPHRCPGWAGGGIKYGKRDLCPDGYVTFGMSRKQLEALYQRGESYNPRWWQLGQCYACDVVVLPYWIRKVDPTNWWSEIQCKSMSLYWKAERIACDLAERNAVSRIDKEESPESSR